MPARMQPARAGLAWMQPNFEVLRKVSACVDDRHLKIMAEFDLGEPNFEVLRKASACDDDRHFSKTLQNSMRLRVTHRRSGLDQGSPNADSIPRAGTKAKW